MLDVFLCHSPATTAIAEQIATRLERGAEAKVWLEETSTLVEDWECGLSSAAIILLLSNDAVPGQGNRAAWGRVLDHTGEPQIAFVKAEACPYPPLLERSHFYHWAVEAIPVLRSLERWIIGLHTQTSPQLFSPSRLPWFDNRKPEMEMLFAELVDRGGASFTLSSDAPSGKTALAQEFARAAVGHFRDILWVGCGERSDAAITGDLMAQLGAVAIRDIPALLHEHRLLVVFDDLRREIPIRMRPGSRASVLVTTREAPDSHNLTPVGAPSLVVPRSAEAQRLWRSIAVCHTTGTPLELACRIAGLDQRRGSDVAEELIASRLADPLDSHRLRLPAASRALAREHADIDELQRLHARLVEPADAFASEIPAALAYACHKDWARAKDLGFRASDFFRNRNRNPEAAEILNLLVTEARSRGDEQAAHQFQWELSWLQDGTEQIRVPMLPGEQLQLGLAL